MNNSFSCFRVPEESAISSGTGASFSFAPGVGDDDGRVERDEGVWPFCRICLVYLAGLVWKSFLRGVDSLPGGPA